MVTPELPVVVSLFQQSWGKATIQHSLIPLGLEMWWQCAGKKSHDRACPSNTLQRLGMFLDTCTVAHQESRCAKGKQSQHSEGSGQAHEREKEPSLRLSLFLPSVLGSSTDPGCHGGWMQLLELLPRKPNVKSLLLLATKRTTTNPLS